MMTPGTIIVGLILLGVVAAIVRNLKKKKGGCSCGDSCSSCSHCDHF